MIFAALLFVIVMLAVALFPVALPRLMRLQPFLRRHRRAVNVAFLICLSVTMMLYVTGCAGASFLTDLEAVLSTALSGATGILQILATVDPAIAPVVTVITPIAVKIEADLTEAKTLQAEYQSTANESTLAQIEALITTITGNLNTLLQTNGLPAAEAAQVQNIASIVNTELQKLLSTLPVFSSATASQTLTVTKPSTAADFKAKIQAALPPAA